MRIKPHCLLALVLGLAAAVPAARADTVRLAGPPGPEWNTLGAKLKQIWEQAIPGLKVESRQGRGPANLRSVAEAQTDLGYGVSVMTADAAAGKAPFAKPYGNLCHVAALYPHHVHVVVRVDAGIESFKDVKGRPLTTQPEGSVAETVAADLLQAHGLVYDDVKPSFTSQTDAVQQVVDGQAQALVLAGTLPSTAVIDIAADRDIRLLDMAESLEAIRKLNPAYRLLQIPAGTYAKQRKPVRTIGYAVHVFASCRLPADLIYGLTRSIAQNAEALVHGNAALDGPAPADMAADIGVPWHPGAVKFYREWEVSR
jgi:TRAP transporter TAXI family solute receptor